MAGRYYIIETYSVVETYQHHSQRDIVKLSGEFRMHLICV